MVRGKHFRASGCIKALGFKKYFNGAKEKQISINLSFDSDSKQLTFGATYSEKDVKGGALSGGFMFGDSQTTEKETSKEAKVGYDFEDNKLIAKIDSAPDEGEDAKEKEVHDATMSIGTVTETDDEFSKISIGVNP